ncbi:hypothetical protein [Subtercola sp. RTI3]|uniref:hypothetical protein n=1 Tax=Subtercola sp. RTI3 TaxID=3048639 RepID=UPI002B2224D3|nr:hypothetical protein [Subtercola sp. RTI3]
MAFFVLMIVGGIALRATPFGWVAIVIFGVSAYCAFLFGFMRQAKFGKEIAEDLRLLGYRVDRVAPLRNTYLFEKWRNRNSIPAAAIRELGNSKYQS